MTDNANKKEEFRILWSKIESREPKEYTEVTQALENVGTLGKELHSLRELWITVEKFCFNNNLFEDAIEMISEKLDENGPMRTLLKNIEHESGQAEDIIRTLKSADLSKWIALTVNLLTLREKVQYIICTFHANMYYSVLGIGLKLWQGRCYGMRGQFQKANECFQRGVESFRNFEKAIDNVELVQGRIPVDLMTLLESKIPNMKSLLQEKNTFVQQTLPSFKTTMRFSIIVLYIMNGDITNAIAWFKEAWNDLTNLDESEVPSAFHSSPIVPHISNEDILKMNEIKKWLDDYSKEDIPATKGAFVNNILGILCQQFRKPEDFISSEIYHKESLRLYEQVNNIDGITASRFNLGYLALFVRHNATDAKQHFTRIKELAVAHDKNGEYQRAQIFLGFAHLLDEHYGLAIQELNNPTCQDIKEEYFTIMRLYGLALAYWKLNEHQVARQYINECVERSKRTLNNASSSRLVLSAFELHHQLSELHQLISVSLGDVPSAVEVSDWFKLSLTSLSYNTNVVLRQEDAVTVRLVQAFLDETSAIVVYSSCKDVFRKTCVEYIYLISKKEVKAFQQPKSTKKYSVVSVSDVPGATRGVPPKPVSLEEEDMYPLVLHEALEKFSYVGFVFQGKWSNPATFTIPDSSKHLIEEKHLCILPSLFWFVKQRYYGLSRRVALDNRSVTLLGGLTSANLDEVQHEIKHIEELLKVTNPKPVTGQHFNRAQVLEALRNNLLNLVHFASHNKPEGHGDTYYELSGKIQLFDKDILAADDILTCPNMERLKLVTLSCCSTANGAEVSIGPLGIYMSFIVVGAECVVATLTSIKDKIANLLMSSFYKHISQFKPKLVAYREAILEHFRESEEWKNYVIIGF